jgi:hypothetical protein
LLHVSCTPTAAGLLLADNRSPVVLAASQIEG